MLFKRIDTVFVQVRDISKAIEWYKNVLGFKLRWHIEEAGYAALDVGCGETPITLVQIPVGAELPSMKHELLTLYAEDIDETYSSLQEKGVEVEALKEGGGVMFFRFRDLDGNLLAACWFPK